MAARTNSVFALPSLFQVSTSAVIHSLDHYENELWDMPDNIKQAVLRLMSKRGLITDQNIGKVLPSQLRTLDLSTSQVSDRCLFQLNNLKSLVKLDLNSFKVPNEAVTSAGIISISKSCPNLQIVYLRRNINLTDDGVIALTQYCPMLRELNVGGCSLLTDASLAAIGNSSQHMKSLNIIATQVTDNGIYSLCQGSCSQVLTELDMSECKNLTDDAVELLISSCPLIRILLFAKCRQITETSRIALDEKQRLTGAKMKQLSWTIY